MSVSTTIFAGQPVWTFTPTTATSVVFPINLSSSILYTVSNQSSRPHTLVIKPLQGVTQVAPCQLAPKGQENDHCTLNLLIRGSDLPSNGISGGPVLCQSNSDGTPNPNQCYQPSFENALQISVGEPLSESIDWRTQGAVTAVKNQGNCQSGYAFSTTGTVEGFYAIHSGSLRGFSEQQILDCSNNAGCDGGTVPPSLDYIIAQSGIALGSSYPYTAHQGICRTVSNVDVHITGYMQVPSQNEIALAEQVEQLPVSATIQVGSWFENYSSADGVINPNCSGDTDYQSVLIVGYTPTYWIIKNSYGRSWGNDGYLYLVRGINACGIANSAFAPI